MKKIAAATVAALALSGIVACGVPTSQSSAAAPVTPAACLSALGHADELQALSAEAFDVVGEALTYASQLNAAGINAQTEKLRVLQPKVVAARSAYDSSAAECRSYPS